MGFARGRVPAALLALAGVVALAPAAAQEGPPGPTPEIVNGLPTTEWPSVAFLAADGSGCSATFIGCRTVLTAAHCVCDSGNSGPACPDGTFLADPANSWVFLQHAGDFPVESIRVEPGYEFGSGHDVAVLELAWPVRGVAPSPINGLGSPAFGTAATIVGFGRTTENSSDGGIKRVGAVSTSSCVSAGVPNSTHVCWRLQAPVGPPGSDSTTCFGDSGGPLFADVGAGLAQAGIHSGLVGSCTVNDTGFDTDVFVDSTWIQSEQTVDQSQLACGPGSQVGDVQVTTASFEGTLVSQASHSFAVPAGTKELRVALNAEIGSSPNDYDLYVRFGAPPTLSAYDCAPLMAGSFEYCALPDPAAGTWYVLVDLYSGSSGDYQVTATMLPEQPAPPALADGAVVLADFQVGEVAQLDPATGERAIASSSLRGAGLPLDLPEDVLFDDDGSLLLANMAIPAILRVDPVTGDRTVVSGCADAACTSSAGSGPAFLGPRFVAREDDTHLVVSDRYGTTVSAVVRVDEANGNRTLLSGCTDTACSSELGTGPSLDRVFGIAVEDDGRILVADTLALVRIEPGSGARTVVSGCENPACTSEAGSGLSFGEPHGVAVDANGDVLVTDSAVGSDFRAIFKVDPSSGARSVLSGCADASCSSLVGSGPNFGDGLIGIALAPGGDLWVSDSDLGAVFQVDPATGERTLVSGCADTACSSAAGSGPLLSEPLGLTVLPEPDGTLSLATGLAFLLFAHRRRCRRGCP